MRQMRGQIGNAGNGPGRGGRVGQQPGGDMPLLDGAALLTLQMGSAKTAALGHCNQLALSIEQFEISQRRARAKAAQMSTQRHCLRTAAHVELADLDRQQGNAAPAGNGFGKKIHQRLKAQIQHGGMQHVRSAVQTLVQLECGVQAMAGHIDHRVVDALERRAIVQPQGTGKLVMPDMVNLLQACGRSASSLSQRNTRLRRLLGGLEQTACGVQRPGIAGQALAAENLETAIARLHHQAQTAGVFAIKHQRGNDVQFLQGAWPTAQPLAGSGQGHLSIRCPRKDDGTAHLVIEQPGQDGGVEYVFPGQHGIGNDPAQQRMHTAALQGLQALDRGGLPMAFTLPRVVGQANALASVGETGFERLRICKQNCL